MKRFTLLLALSFGLLITSSYADGKKGEKKDDVLRKSTFFEPNPFINNTSFPEPFNETDQAVEEAAVSTGYYYVDSNDELEFPNNPARTAYWKPTVEFYDTTQQTNLWTKILAGPRILPKSYWDQNPDAGLAFFRNPAIPATPGPTKNFWLHGEVNASDTVNNAFAGPMSIGFPFYFNGVRYDSFYVSTNGVIALTNRRYYYDQEGNRALLPQTTNAYDNMSMDWFLGGDGGARERNFAEADQDGDGIMDGPGTGDPMADNFGYLYSVCGGDETNITGGIRNPNVGNMQAAVPLQHKSALIAPFWGNLHLSQWNSDLQMVDNHSKVWFRRFNDNSKLVIYYINANLHGTVVNDMGQQANVPYNGRPGDQNYVSATAQVTLNRVDSSVTFNYENFSGSVNFGFRTYEAAKIYRFNTVAGVRGFARHVNYPTGVDETDDFYPWGGEYVQFTHYFAKFTGGSPTPFPERNLAVRFKQWQNTLRVIDIQYMARKLDENASLDFTERVLTGNAANYELLAGEERIGAIQPVCIVQNISNQIQGPNGVNFVPQDVEFRTRFVIVNEITAQPIYNRIVPVSKECLEIPDITTNPCNGQEYVKVRLSDVENNNGNYEAEAVDFVASGNDGIPPYGFVQVFFPPFEPNEFEPANIGRLRAYIIADPSHPETGESLGDEWPFDDTTDINLFVMNRLTQFEDNVSIFNQSDRGPIPSVLKWVNIDAQVVPSESVTHHPLPPLGRFRSQWELDWLRSDTTNIISPCIKMNRLTFSQQDHPADANGFSGDQLRSFPIDMRNRYDAVLSLSISRVANPADQTWDRGFGDNQLIGPEPLAFVNLNMFNWYKAGMSASANPDEIVVELAQPSPDGIKFITNIPDDRWRNHPRRAWGGAPVDPVTDMAALTVYGAGGYMVGFQETDPDSSFSQPDFPNLKPNGFRPQPFDEGFDEEFKKYFVAIPDTFINAPNEGAKNFRFRIKVRATNDKKGMMNINDDDDDFFVDNVTLLFPSEQTDIEVSAVKIRWPYTVAPASQATDIPVWVSLSNNTSVVAKAFEVQVDIYKGRITDLSHDNFWPTVTPVYCRRYPLATMDAGIAREIAMPGWNARQTGDGQYTIRAITVMEDGDLKPVNDTTFTYVDLKFGNVFAYEPENAQNDVESRFFTNSLGRGLNLYASNTGGIGANTYQSGWHPDQDAAGVNSGNGAGQIAMKFVLRNQDTLRGYQAMFANKNQAPDHIRFLCYEDSQDLPAVVVQGTLLPAQRGMRDLDQFGQPVNPNDPGWNQYGTYLLDNPVVLAPGTYWIAIAQLGETGMELAASKSRMGMRSTFVTNNNPAGPLGGNATHLMLDKSLRKKNNADQLINNNVFAAENVAGTNQWFAGMPTFGNPMYPHMGHFGVTPVDGSTHTLTRGTWIPLLRPYFGLKNETPGSFEEECPQSIIPVEYRGDFNGKVRKGSIDLTWSTAWEENNSGFYVERRVPALGSEWQQVGWVDGMGNKSSVTEYNYADQDVVFNTTYEYRLRNVDFDGTHNCPSDNMVVLTYNYGDASIESWPSRVETTADIRFVLPEAGNAKVEIVDLYGNIVKTYNIEDAVRGMNSVEWNTYGDNDMPVAQGTYILRMTSGEKVVNSKINVIR